MTKDEGLRLALEALKNSQYRFAEYGYQAMQKTIDGNKEAIKAVEAALEAKDEHEQLRDENERLHVENRRLIDRIETIGVPVGVGGFATTTSLEAKDEPVAFLANGTRFKISYDSRQSGGQIHSIPPELGGRWVALVAAENDCHMQLTTPPQRKPLRVDKDGWYWLSKNECIHVDLIRKVEEAHGIK